MVSDPTTCEISSSGVHLPVEVSRLRQLRSQRSCHFALSLCIYLVTPLFAMLIMRWLGSQTKINPPRRMNLVFRKCLDRFWRTRQCQRGHQRWINLCVMQITKSQSRKLSCLGLHWYKYALRQSTEMNRFLETLWPPGTSREMGDS